MLWELLESQPFPQLRALGPLSLLSSPNPLVTPEPPGPPEFPELPKLPELPVTPKPP